MKDVSIIFDQYGYHVLQFLGCVDVQYGNFDDLEEHRLVSRSVNDDDLPKFSSTK
ncbi:hypothetical protein Tco_0835875, partial [Tanacetum coccineum]